MDSEVLIHSFAASYIRSNFSGSSAKRAMKDYGNFILGLKFKQVLAANPTVKSRFESKLKGGDEFPDFMTNVDNNFPDYINDKFSTCLSPYYTNRIPVILGNWMGRNARLVR